MAKIMKKKKNYKLRRRVMRTVSALTMVMAVTVAAIPVENLGTVSAEESLSMGISDMYDADKLAAAGGNTSIMGVDLYDSTYQAVEKDYTDEPNEVIISRLEKTGNSLMLTEAYKAKIHTDLAIAVEPVDSNTSMGLDFKYEEYYDYVFFDQDYITAIKDMYDGEKYTAKFPVTTNSFSAHNSVNYTGTDGGSYTANLSGVTINRINNITDVNTTGITFTTTNAVTGTAGDLSVANNDYTKRRTGTTDAKNVYVNQTNVWNEHMQLIRNYNNTVDPYIRDLQNIENKINAGNTLSKAEVDRWGDIVYEMGNQVGVQYNTAQTLERTFSQLLDQDLDRDTLSDIVEFIICNYYSHKSISGQYLDVYTLELVYRVYTDSADRSVWVPKLINNKQQFGSQEVDANNYMCGGQTKVVGIASNAFKGSRVTSVSIPKEFTFIGSGAFQNCGALTKVTIDDGGLEIIGEDAFNGCERLATVSFVSSTSGLRKIGKRAFQYAPISTIQLPDTVKNIGSECFASTSLTSLEFKSTNNSGTVDIGAYAFYNCLSLTDVKFSDTPKYIIRKGAFAVGEGQDADMTKFTFPRANSTMIFNNGGTGESSKKRTYKTDGTIDDSGDEEKYDYILAGRTRLEEVTLPARLNGKVPDFIFKGCINLGHLIFPYGTNDSTGDATYNYDKLFQDVTNTELYVEGPALTYPNSPKKAQPRKDTWRASSKVSELVPYMFTDKDGTHFEIGVQGGAYIATVDVTQGTSEAKLSKYSENTEFDGELPKKDVSIVIPAKVGEYTVVSIGDNCFDDDLKDKITEVIIQDASVRTIGENAFANMRNLQWVEIGDAVSRIGKSAFEGCTSLENVVFSQTSTSNYGDEPQYWENALTIEENAFKTGSQYLTFHGAINKNYAPFKLAMSENNTDMLGSKSQIFYVTDAPLNLRVIRDNATGLATLIDYPHYEEIDSMNGDNKAVLQEREDNNDTVGSDYSITEKFEIVHGMRSDTATPPKYNGAENMYPFEGEIVDQALNLVLPSGIQSIDSKKYFSNSANSNDAKYFTRVYADKYEKLIADGKKEDGSAADAADIKRMGSLSYYEVNPNGDLDEIKRNLYDKDGNKVATSGSEVSKVSLLYYDYEPRLEIETASGTQPLTSEGNMYLKDGIDDKVIAGLFSGVFKETTKAAKASYDIDNSGFIWEEYDNHTYVENHYRGNDYLTRISEMGSVEELPAFAFNSAENLLSVKISEALSKVGMTPFRDCKSMYDIDTSENSKYTFENMIFFEEQDDGTNMILQCLEGRGRTDGDPGVNYGLDRVVLDTNPTLATVTSIADYAFSNIENLTEADLSATSVKKIPEGIFDNDEALTKVTLSDSVNEIEQYAFRGCAGPNGTLEVHIGNPLCVISDKAFDFDRTRKVIIFGVKYVDEQTEEESPCYNSYLQLEKVYTQNKIEFVDKGNEYLVQFVDHEFNVITNDDGTLASYVVKSHDTAPHSVTAPLRTGYKFDGWVCRVGNTVLRDEETWLDVTEDRTIIATYVTDPSAVVSDGKEYTLTVNNGRALINGEVISTFPVTVKGGASVTLMATDEANFSVWTISPRDYLSLIDNPSAYTTLFTMPNANVVITANSAIDPNNPPGGNTPGGNTPGGDTPGGDTPGGDTPGGNDGTKYTLTVNYGSGSGEYAAGTTVTISAYAPESSSRVFSRWTSTNTSLGFASATSATTTIIMPAENVTVTANYKTRLDDDDDDDDDRRRPGTNTTTTVTGTGTGTNNSGNNGSVGSVTNDGSNGSKIYITKNGISNKDLASVTVTGSTDNFIVKITESEEATRAVEEALINRYGSLDGLVYFPMDISLYDSTGQHKITDTHGLNITITMPIPDVLIQYAGNNRVAAADNGTLQQLQPKFTTIEGIACISFIPPHFSPYVIYVDTSNLVAGQTLDSTPSTGDPIHPKWFLAIGLACMSVVLFATSDVRKRKSYKTA